VHDFFSCVARRWISGFYAALATVSQSSNVFFFCNIDRSCPCMATHLSPLVRRFVYVHSINEHGPLAECKSNARDLTLVSPHPDMSSRTALFCVWVHKHAVGASCALANAQTDNHHSGEDRRLALECERKQCALVQRVIIQPFPSSNRPNYLCAHACHLFVPLSIVMR
jgi:hypothetical protein